MSFKFSDSDYLFPFVRDTMMCLAYFLPKGGSIRFEICDRGGSKVSFVCPQKYTREEADDLYRRIYEQQVEEQEQKKMEAEEKNNK